MFGELFEQLGARFGFAFGHLVGQRDRLGRFARDIMIGAFERDNDEAGDLFAVTDRDLARDQW